MSYEKSIFESQSIPRGYSWTIVTKLGHILENAENYFGKRDQNYTILGVKTSKSKTPKIWFPNFENSKNIVIQITENCLNNMDRAVFQVAHEVIHCLSPIKNTEISVLEEGLATFFAIEYCSKNNHGKNWRAEKEEYENACVLIKKLLDIDSNIIKKLRIHQPSLSLVDDKLILKTSPKVPILLAKELCKKFKNGAMI